MILRAAWLAPIASPPIRDGFVAVENGRIADLGPCSRLHAGGEPILNLGEVLLTPGLVNPHTHLELTCYHNAVPPQPFWPWIQRMMQLRTGDGWLEREQAAAADGAWRSLRAGVTCVGDISRCNVSWRALRHVPIRKVCFAEILSVAVAPPRTPAELRESVATIEEDDLLTAGVTPHAPYTVPADYIRASAELAAELSRPWTTHWAETVEEVALLRGDDSLFPERLREIIRGGGVRPTALGAAGYLASLTAALRAASLDDEARRIPLAHCNYLSEDDAARLGSLGFVGVYCPRAHRFFQHPPHPFVVLRRAGLPFVFGTDSLASNDSLSILEELRYVRESVPGAPSDTDLLRMATLDAATTLGLASRIGSIEIGKLADLAAFPLDGGEELQQRDPVAEIIRHAPRPTHVFVGGEQIKLADGA